jgi:phosphatidylinositol alpha 1,6-mannosyltransferase
LEFSCLTSLLVFLFSVVLTIRKIEQEILAAGHHVCILTTKSGDMKNTHLDGEHPNRSVIFLDNSIPIPFLHDPNNPECSYQLGFSLSKAMKEQIAEFEPSLIHITVPDSTCLHLIQYAREREIPLMGTYHSNIPEYMSHYPGLGWLKHILAAFFRHQYNFLQALYVPTPFIHRYLTDTFQMDKVTKLGIWGRGIDLETFSPKHRSLEFRQRMGFDEHDVVIMWCGRLVPEKRPDIFCKVVRKLHERGIPFKALVVGQGPVEEEVKNLPNTVFAGWMSGDELSTAYASSDVFLFPSAVETFGNVTLEAAASGLPLVVESGCSGHLVNHGVNGFACRDADVDAYFDATLCLVVDDTRRKSMSQEGRVFSLQFEKREVCRKMLVNYSTVTDEFYCKYGGLHSNRDREYQNEDSFLGGNIPRPTVLVFVELIFISLFMGLYHVAAFFSFIRKKLSPSSPAAEPVAKVRPLMTSAPKPWHASPRQLSLDAHLGCIKEMAECRDSSDMEETQDKDCRIKSVIVFPVKEDDETDSTTSLSDESSNEMRRPGSKPCCALPQQPNFKVSHVMAIGFVKLMQLQFRIESQIRNMTIDTVSSSSWSNAKRKRKNSSIGGVDLFDIEKKTSGDHDSLSEDSMDYMLNAAREERLSMRRSSSVLSPALEV